MTRAQRLSRLLLLAILALAPGCLAKSNPEYFPNFGPFNRVEQTHAKPGGLAYFRDYDPHAIKLDVFPLESSSPVGYDQLVVATVYDDKNKARRNRRVEWLLEGVGQIMEVDESGYFPGRGGKLENTWAFSYTDYLKHTLSRHTGNQADDVEILPGQTWCVIRSMTEGTSHLTVYAPEIANWSNNKVTVNHTWVNAAWTFPPPATAPAGRDFDLVTHVFRPSDHQGLANYSVRYRVLPSTGSPQAAFLPAHSAETTVSSDLDGNAHAFLTQAAAQAGTNRIGIEIYRSDPGGGAPMFIARGETTVEWDAARIFLSHSAPPALMTNQDNPFSITVSNYGKSLVKYITVRQTVPEGLTYVSSVPAASQENNQLSWGLGQLEAGKTRAIQVMYRPTRMGSIESCISAETDEGYRGEKCITVQVASPQLKVTVNVPPTGTVGVPIDYQITVTNSGSGQATNVKLRADFDPGLVHTTNVNPVDLTVGTMAAGQTQSFGLTLKPTATGSLATHLTATADGNLINRADATVTVQDTKLKVSIDGPAWRYADRPADWTIHVKNSSNVAMNNVELRDVLPPEVSFQEASNDGRLLNRQVVWNLGTLNPSEEKQVKVTIRCEKPTDKAGTVNKVIASANRQLTFEEAAPPLEIRGVPSFGLKVVDLKDPVEVGGTTTYQIEVANQGSLDGNEVEIRAKIPVELLQVVNVRGPGASTWRRDGDDVVFLPLDGLRPKQSFTYLIEAKAVKPGEAVVDVELKTKTMPRPLLAQESTRLFRAPGTLPPTGEPPLGETGPPPLGQTGSLLTPKPFARLSASLPAQ